MKQTNLFLQFLQEFGIRNSHAQYSVSPTNGRFKYTKDNNDGYIYYSKINDILFITIVNCYVKSGYTTLCTLPQGCRPTGQIVFAIANKVIASVHNARYGIIKDNGEVTIKANANGEYIWTTTATILNLQHSVSRIIKTKQIDATTDTNGYLKTGLNAKQIPIGIGGLSDARYAFHTGNESDNGRTIRLMAWDGSVGRFSNKYVNVIVYYVKFNLLAFRIPDN